MSLPPSPESLVADPLPENLVAAGGYRTAAEGFEHGLVALAAGWAFWLVPAENPGDGYRLLVEPAGLEEVREQLAKYDQESADWPPRPVVDPAARRRAELVTPLLWALAVLGGFWAQREWPGATAAGAVDARAIFTHGEVWRAATALFLHADTEHLASNLFSGVAVFAAVLTTLGRRRGWALLASAAVLGNLTAAAANFPGEYRSLGASTAIFAALGLLTGRAVRVMTRTSRAQRWRAMAVPLAAGLTALGLFGAGGVQIDVLAHATGFAWGGGLGVFFGRGRGESVA